MSLGYSNTEMRALAMRWATGGVPEDQQQQIWDKMSIRERKLFKRLLKKVDEKKLHSAESFVTKREMVGYMAVLIEQKMVPLAANLDEVTQVVEYLALPLHKRLWVRAKVLWEAFINWLDRRGVRFVQLNRADAQEVDDVDEAGEVLDHAEPRGEEAGATRPADPELRDGPEVDRLHAGEQLAEADRDEGRSGQPAPGPAAGTRHVERRAGSGVG